MKIIILHRNSFDVVGGVESTIYYIAESLKKLGHTPVVVAKEREGSNDNNSFCKIVRYKKSPFVNRYTTVIDPFLEYINAKQLKKIFKEEQPDYIITRDNILSCAISKFVDSRKIVYVPLGVIKFYNAGIRKFNSLKTLVIEIIRFLKLKQESYYQIKAFKKLKKIVVFSNNMKNQISSAIGNASAVDIVHPGVNEKFSPIENASQIHKEFNIPEDKKIFLFVGRVVQEKNVRMLLEAFSLSDNGNAVLLIVGDGDDRKYLEDRAKALNIDDKVIFTGIRRDTERFYREADFFVLPSYYESFGNVILEALASGTPVIGFKTEEGKTLTAVDELIENGKSGFVCDNFSQEALKAAINKAMVMSQTDEYKNMRKFCAQTARTNFTWNGFVERVLDILQEDNA